MSPAARLAVFGRLLDAMVAANLFDFEHENRPPSGSVAVHGDVAEWQDAARAVDQGFASCPAIAAWRLAELLHSGERARWVFDGPKIYIERANGKREDPCRGVRWLDGERALSHAAYWSPKMEFQSFETTPPEGKMAVICKMLEVLHEANGQWLRAGGQAPPLYQSGVYYKDEELGQDLWQDIPRTLQLGNGDCEDVSSYRVSELRAAGEPAEHVVEHRKSPRVILYHILVRRADGSIEDPSCRLGMPGKCSDLVHAEDVWQMTAGAGVDDNVVGSPPPIEQACAPTPEEVVMAAAGWIPD